MVAVAVWLSWEGRGGEVTAEAFVWKQVQL